jgi:hypothetical protein
MEWAATGTGNHERNRVVVIAPEGGLDRSTGATKLSEPM